MCLNEDNSQYLYDRTLYNSLECSLLDGRAAEAFLKKEPSCVLKPTPLIEAVRERNSLKVRRLLSSGENPNIELVTLTISMRSIPLSIVAIRSGIAPLAVAAANNDADCVRELLLGKATPMFPPFITNGDGGAPVRSLQLSMPQAQIIVSNASIGKPPVLDVPGMLFAAGCCIAYPFTPEETRITGVLKGLRGAFTDAWEELKNPGRAARSLPYTKGTVELHFN